MPDSEAEIQAVKEALTSPCKLTAREAAVRAINALDEFRALYPEPSVEGQLREAYAARMAELGDAETRLEQLREVLERVDECIRNGVPSSARPLIREALATQEGVGNGI